MGFKEEFKHQLNLAKKDIVNEVNKKWSFEYQGHIIEVINQVKEELLKIDGEIVAHKKRKSAWSHIIPFSKLFATVELNDGKKHDISVKLGGFTALHCIVKMDNEVLLQESSKLEFLPWNHKEKIIPFIQAKMQTNNDISEVALPDDEYFYGANEARLAPGLFDQLVLDSPNPLHVKKLIKLFSEQVKNPETDSRKALYEKIIFEYIASYRNELIEQVQQLTLDEADMKREALWLLEHAAHRDVVKFAIIVLGFTNCEEHKDLLFLLAMHSEFTPYVLFAWKNGTNHANEQIWKLAHLNKGYGKVAAIEQLEARTPEMKYWLLIEGYKDRLLHELAYTCATKGELDVALYEDTISKELYDGASCIIQGLLSEEMMQGINEYAYASSVLSRFIHHAKNHCITLEDFYVIIKIKKFIDADEDIWQERFMEQWKPHERNLIAQGLQEFIQDPKWLQLALDVIEVDVDFIAIEVARFYQINILPLLLELLENNPINTTLYEAIMSMKDIVSIEKLCMFAEANLSLEHLAEDEQDCLLVIIQDLHDFEGVGLTLLVAALQSGHEGLSYYALSALEVWTPATWKETKVLTAIEGMIATAKDKENRMMGKGLLER